MSRTKKAAKMLRIAGLTVALVAPECPEWSSGAFLAGEVTDNLPLFLKK